MQANNDIRGCNRIDKDPRLAAIVESSNDAIIAKDLSGVVFAWNRAAERLFGYTASEMIGQPLTVIFPPDRMEEEAFILGQIAVVKQSNTMRRPGAAKMAESSGSQQRFHPSGTPAAKSWRVKNPARPDRP